MNIDVQKVLNITVLVLEGRLDTTNSGDLEVMMSKLIENREKKFVLDLSKLTYISSSGLRSILIGAKRLKKTGGEIVLCSMNKQIREVFDCSGFSQIFRIYPDDTTAFNSF